MTTLGYFLRTPSRYRRKAFFVSSAWMMFILVPFMLTVAPVSASRSLGSIAEVGAPSPVSGPDAEQHIAVPSTVAPPPAPAPEHVWPAKGQVTLEFGAPDWPYMAHHTGIDIAGRTGDPVTPFMAGTVVKAGAVLAGCGNCVFVDHGNGVVSHYSHLSSILVHVGQVVSASDVIGLEGTTGWSTGPHVHFEIDVNGTPVNPRGYVPGNPAPRG